MKREMGVPSVARHQLSPIASPVTSVTQLHNSFCGNHLARTDESPPVVKGASEGTTVLKGFSNEVVSGVNSGKWRVVHVFCGRAQLGQVLASRGFSVAAVDLPSCDRMRDGSWVPLELWRPAEQHLLTTAIRAARSIAFFWLEVPAASFSKAREVPLPEHLRSKLGSALPSQV